MDKATVNSDNIKQPLGSTACSGLASSATPEVSDSKESDAQKQGCPPVLSVPKQETSSLNEKKWHVLRATYGREEKAYNYLQEHGIEAFWPTQVIVKREKKHLRRKTVSLMQNMLFAYDTEENLKKFVYDNVHLPYLRFYYRHYHYIDGTEVDKPMIVPNGQMKSFKLICESPEEDIIISPEKVQKFEEGQLVRVLYGEFEGVVGRVARYKGQQRVGVIIDGLLTAATTYIPKGHLEILPQ